MKIESTVWKGNRMGAGFARIPKDSYSNFGLGENIKVEILNENGSIVFHPVISSYKNYLGFYIPKNICIGNKLWKKRVKVRIEKICGFHSKLGSDGRLHIPKVIAEKYDLKKDDLIAVKGRIGDKKIERICKIHARKIKNECLCLFSNEKGNKEGVFIVKKKLKRKIHSRFLKAVLNNVNYGKINEEKVIAFYTSTRPIIISSKLKMDNNLIYYLGCYFADGTKRGTSWGITASTFEQANFYLKMHKKLIFNLHMHTYLSITSKSSLVKDKLKREWKNKCGIDIEDVRLRLSKKGSRKINPNGSLIIREYSQSPQRFYHRLLRYCIQEILKEKNKELALEFIFGVLEGDGSVARSGRGHVHIHTNDKEVEILEKVLKACDLKYNSYKEGAHKYTIRIGVLEILKNFEDLKDKLFCLYPKRRRTLIKRLQTVGAVRFILGKQNYASAWVKAWLKNEDILNENYELTTKGLKIKNNLKDMIKNVR